MTEDNNYFSHETAVIDDPVEIGQGTKIWHFSHVMAGAKLGQNCVLGQNVYVDKDVIIGKGVKIQNNVSVYTGVTLRDYVFCGPSMVFTNVNRPRSGYPTDENDYARTLVKEGATIGANATVVCGNDLGVWSFIGAGSVVTCSVKDHALVYGNPAEQQGWVCECGNLTNEVVNFDVWNCESCGRKYRLSDDRLNLEEPGY